jgi:hypothetical protein
MTKRFGMKCLWIAIGMIASLGWSGVQVRGEIRLMGRLKIAGTSSDKSGLKESLENGTSLSQLGGWSAIASTDRADEFWLLPDRGPKDGAVSYPTRVHRIRLNFNHANSTAIQFELLETVLLRNAAGQSLIGLSAAFQGADAANNLRFDPEGIRVLPSGDLAISDEYGPSVVVFNARSGRASKWFNVPQRFLPKILSGDPDQEIAENQIGRQANGGFEGLAVQPDSKKLLAFAQKPLLQDSETTTKGKKIGSHCRIVEFTTEGVAGSEYLYPLASSSTAVSEILGLGDSQALVLERDSESGRESKLKGVFWIDYSKASHSEKIASVAPGKMPADAQAVSKKLFIDFLDSKFGLYDDKLPAKPEGLALGPNLPDGSRTLIVSVDNDFESASDSELWIFSFSDSDLPQP